MKKDLNEAEKKRSNRKWRLVYFFIIAFLIVQIIAYWLFTKFFE